MAEWEAKQSETERAHAKKYFRKLYRDVIRWGIIGLTSGTAFYLLLVFWDVPQEAYSFLIWFAVIGVVFVVLTPIVGLSGLYPYSISVSDQGIQINSTQFRGHINWDQITDWSLAPQRDASSCHRLTIKRRFREIISLSIGNEHDIEGLRSALQKHIKKSNK